ncbi:MAG: MMPL family transporter [Gammaproteobacteria bacterium]|nr:MMPL family transporter [Gammaproteobacteria bacterium]MBU1730863.1 MMPL family transporter [Gammaproteobacteria bacterium]MBU1893523.1 MMPL family transporter [Gammaproteobacteria bacterium]
MKRWPVMLWLAVLAGCLWWVTAQTRFNTDMAAFLPDSAAPAQQLMVDQLKDGVASRLVLLAVENGSTGQLAESSKKLSRALEASGHFSYVRNGEHGLTPAEREHLMQYRYLLSPTTDTSRFSAAGLEQGLQDSLQLLASPAGAMVKQLLPSDPTGAMLNLLEDWGGASSGPSLQHDVWFSDDGRRALLLAETRAPAFDIDAQQQVGDAIRRAFDESRSSPELRLLMSGPSVFAVQSRNLIHNDAWRLSLVAMLLVSLILLLAYGSPRLLGLGILPVASGALVGIAAVSLSYGNVHGITLGFGATLIGEAVDYPTYLFTQRAAEESLRNTLERIWPTLRLAVLTTVFGSLTMLFSGFSGLSQLGMFSLVGVLAAGLVTRYVLPEIAPDHFAIAHRVQTQALLARGASMLSGLKWLPLLALAAAAAYLAIQRQDLWENELSRLSPIPSPALELDRSLREAMGAPDVRYLIAVPGNTRQAALEHSETIAPQLQELVQQGITAGYDLTARIIPSERTQAVRQAALPEPETLRRNLDQAVAATPFRADIFEPFLRQVEQSRHLPPLQIKDWQGTPLGGLAGGLMVRQGDGWVALISLRNVSNEAALKAFASRLGGDAFLLDIKGESSRMIMQYRDQSLRYSLLGVAAILLVLGIGLRNIRAIFAVLLPVAAAVLATAALLAGMDIKLSLFHVVSLLLVLGIGLNYGLFFNRPALDEAERRRTLFGVLVCAASTVSAFGVLAFSATPVLQAIGITVALGAVLSLLFAAMWAKTK